MLSTARWFALACLWLNAFAAQAQTERNGEWLLRQDPAAFTLQLVTVANNEHVARLQNQHPNAEAFVSYRIQGKGQLLYAITYGVFTSVDAAEQERAAVAQFMGLTPAEVWVRPMASVQKAIRSTLQL
jgi:septal ring-binding cell division protein DamX